MMKLSRPSLILVLIALCLLFAASILLIGTAWRTSSSAGKNLCGSGTEYDEFSGNCVIAGLSIDMDTSTFRKCNDDDAGCYCKAYSYGTRGPKLVPHSSCQKYVSCHDDPIEGTREEIIMQCEPGYAYDVVAQVCYFKGDVDCESRDTSDMGEAIPSQCLSELNPDDPVCGCETYLWNSATLVPEKCYGADDIDFQCGKDLIKSNELEIGIGDGIRPGRAPDDFNETAANTGAGYNDAPWLVSESNPDGEYPFKFPLNQTALVMIDFQRDFVCPGGFGETLGNKVEDLQKALQPARNVLKAARALGMPIIHTLESHKSDLSDLLDNKYHRGDLPQFLRIGKELDLGRILVRGSCGNNIVDAVAPNPGEYLIFKPGKTAFYKTHFDELLQSLGITHLMVAGVTSEVCMQSTVREATDRGYEPLIITDATMSYFERYRQQTIEQLVAQGALVAWAADSGAVVKSLSKACNA
jgi:nicotinamidase-related amidase